MVVVMVMGGTQLSRHSVQLSAPDRCNSTSAVEFRRRDVYQLRAANHHHLRVRLSHDHSGVDTRDDAVAGLAEDLGRALLRFAAQLRSSSLAIGPAEAGQQVPAPSRPATEAQDQDDAGTRGLGASQRRVLQAVQAAG